MSLFCDAPPPHSTPLTIRRQREAMRSGQQLVHILIRTTPAILPSPPAVSELIGDMAWWLLGGCLEKVRILHVRHSDQRAPQAIRRLGKKTRIMQLSENARSPPTSPLGWRLPWKPSLHSGPAEHRWHCWPACQNECEDLVSFFFFFYILFTALSLSFRSCGKSPEKSPEAE